MTSLVLTCQPLLEIGLDRLRGGSSAFTKGPVSSAVVVGRGVSMISSTGAIKGGTARTLGSIRQP